jgi:Pyruvate/2-oxoacid:ferredoxin oxidoreductase gamma subunit
MEAGSSKAVNIVMIGVALGLNLFPMTADEVVYVLKDTFPEKKLGINMKALELGIALSGRMKTNIRENSTIQNRSS